MPHTSESSSGSSPNASELAVITVTFHPDLARLEQQIGALPTTAWLVIVDNASGDETFRRLQEQLEYRPRSHLISNTDNAGLAKALNQGANYAINEIASVQFLLLMDQDSVPIANAIEHLLSAHHELEKHGLPVGCVGPRLIDSRTGLQHGFHRISGWRWTRIYPADSDSTPISCTNLNGSGTLVRASLFRQLGELEEAFFIDHVDTEWAFRVLASGHLLFGIPNARFDHAMGERSLRFWFFGWRIWPHRSPRRHYFLFRNALWLMQRSHVPAVWKTWAIAKLALTFLVHLAMDSRRWQQCAEMASGIRAGLRRPETPTIPKPPYCKPN